MKKINKFFLMGSVALSGMMGFSSCSSDDAADENGKNPGVENGVVKTQFAINVPKAGGNTRQTGDIVQEGNNWSFRGLTNLKIMTTPSELKRGTTDQNFTFVKELEEGIKNGNGDYTSTSKEYKVFTDVEIPVGTTNFLVYANAIPNETVSGKAASMLNGALTANLVNNSGTNCTSNTFSLVKIAGNEYTEPQNKLKKLLNDALALTNWKAATAEQDNAMYNARVSFTKLEAGSANSIRLTFQDLYDVATLSSSTAASEVIDYIKSIYEIDSDGKLVTLKGNASGLDSYPTDADILMPEGAAQVKYTKATDSESFDYVNGGNVIGGTNKVNVYNITYPAALYYYANTPIKATTDGSFNSWPTTATNWSTETWTGWTDRVEANTRTIALKDNLNYGNALLVTQFQTTQNVLDDNASGNGYLADNKISVPSEGFKVTGVLVGGQPNQSGWDFLPSEFTDDKFTNTVYDKISTNIVAKVGTPSDDNYTLLMDNTILDTDNNRSSDQSKVNIAVEFENNSGKTFYGVNGKIMPGAKFYLIAQLSPEGKKVTNVTNPSVFMRDYKTTALLKITSLKNAYNTIPDIRSTKLQLGISVDLVWQQGLSFDVPFE